MEKENCSWWRSWLWCLKFYCEPHTVAFVIHPLAGSSWRQKEKLFVCLVDLHILYNLHFQWSHISERIFLSYYSLHYTQTHIILAVANSMFNELDTYCSKAFCSLYSTQLPSVIICWKYCFGFILLSGTAMCNIRCVYICIQ